MNRRTLLLAGTAAATSPVSHAAAHTTLPEHNIPEEHIPREVRLGNELALRTPNSITVFQSYRLLGCGLERVNHAACGQNLG